MFSEIPKEMLERMKRLEEIDCRDRADGTTRMQRLRQIPPETGKFLALMASSCPAGAFVEIGTSAGYSTMWLSLAARLKKTSITTFEILPEKILLAKETIRTAGLADCVELVEGDALAILPSINNISCCFLDAEKEVYEACWDIVSSRIVQDGMLLADNAINHYTTLEPMIRKVLRDDRFDSLVVPVGQGVLMAKRK